MTLDGADRLVRRLSALSDGRQRVAVLSEESERLGTAAFTDLLAVTFDRASSRRREEDQVALAAIMDYLDSEFFDHDRRAEMLGACREGGHSQLQRLLFSPEGHRSEEVERVPDYGKGRPLTLGERKSLARRPNRNVLERVLADPHPAVIHNLLRNPKLTESDVIRLVSKRPNYEKVLWEVYQSGRWSLRYPIKLALARNPYSPPAMVFKLVPQLMRQDLLEMLDDRGLHPGVLMACRRLVEGEVEPEEPGAEEEDDPTIH